MFLNQINKYFLNFFLAFFLTLIFMSCSNDSKEKSEKNAITSTTIIGSQVLESTTSNATTTEVPKNFKVAFMGDSGKETNATAVLNLIIH